jgi:hypothetical protein
LGRPTKMRFLAAPALALMALTTTAHAQKSFTAQPFTAVPPIATEFRNLRLIPPEVYDHEYDKPLELVQVRTEDEVRAACAVPFEWKYAMGCNKRWSYQCKIIMLADDVLRNMGMPPEAIYRHERGHCNGWDGTHWGGRTMQEVGIDAEKVNTVDADAQYKPYFEGLTKALFMLELVIPPPWGQQASWFKSAQYDKSPIDGLTPEWPENDKSDAGAKAADAAKEASFNKPVLAELLGRDPTESELYLARNQGLGGAKAILINPHVPAWQSVRPFYSDQFAQSKGYANGDAMAQAAIQTQVSDRLKGTPVDQISGKAFSDDLAQKFQKPHTPEQINRLEREIESLRKKYGGLDGFSGLSLGGRVSPQSKEYQEYQCTPSEQFEGVTWCNKQESGGLYRSSYTIAHSREGTIYYLNRALEPAFFNAGEVDAHIDRLSRKFGEQARRVRSHVRLGPNTDGIIAIWGKVTLEPLDGAGISELAAGRSPRKGILVNFLGNLSESARRSLDVYRVTGGPGFVWAGSFNSNGQGTLRFFAIDPSALLPIVSKERTEAAPPYHRQ